MNSNVVDQKVSGKHDRMTSGVVLVIIGLWLLVSNVVKVDLGAAVPLGLGLIFLVWGSMARKLGLLIPGGILIGSGAGALLILGPFSGLEGEAEGGLFLLAFAGGWALITLASALFIRKVAWWPLIPVSILAFIGAMLLIGGPALTVLATVGQGWPLVLIAIGLYLLLWRKGLQE